MTLTLSVAARILDEDLDRIRSTERTPMPSPQPSPPAPTGPPGTSVADYARVPWTFVALVPSERHYENAKTELVHAGGTILAARRGTHAARAEDAAASVALDRLVAVDTVLRELEECVGAFGDGPLKPSARALECHVERVHQAISALRYAVNGDPGHGDEG